MNIRFSRLLFFVLAFPLFSAGAGETDPEWGAYIPYYRLKFAAGAENVMGRPAYDPAPHAWRGRLLNSPPSYTAPSNWADSDWSLFAGRSYNTYIFHIPIERLLDGSSPEYRRMSWVGSLIHRSGTHVWFSVIGGSGDFLALAEDERQRDELASRLAGIAREYGLAGVDLDWEFPAAAREREQKAFALLAAAVKEKLPPGTLLSAAVSRWRLPGRELLDTVDRIRLMAYDGYGRHATYESALADVEILSTRYEQPLSKIILGLPFYGRIYSQDSEDYFRGTKSYREIVEEFSPEPGDDEAGGYYFNGPETIERKVRWAAEKGLGGIFVWEPFHDAPGASSLSGVLAELSETLEWTTGESAETGGSGSD